MFNILTLQRFAVLLTVDYVGPWGDDSVEGNFEKLYLFIPEGTVQVSDTVRFQILDAVKFRKWCSEMKCH